MRTQDGKRHRKNDCRVFFLLPDTIRNFPCPEIVRSVFSVSSN